MSGKLLTRRCKSSLYEMKVLPLYIFVGGGGFSRKASTVNSVGQACHVDKRDSETSASQRDVLKDASNSVNPWYCYCVMQQETVKTVKLVLTVASICWSGSQVFTRTSTSPVITSRNVPRKRKEPNGAASRSS